MISFLHFFGILGDVLGHLGISFCQIWYQNVVAPVVFVLDLREQMP